METFVQLLATGDSALLVLALAAFTLGAVLGVAAARLRPRARRPR